MTARVARAGGAIVRRSHPLRFPAVLTVIGCLAGGCQSGSPETTGSIGPIGGLSLFRGKSADEPARVSRAEVEALGEQYKANPSDLRLAMRYARYLRAVDQKSQAVAVLQQAALRNPKEKAVLAAYGKSLVDVGRFAEAAEVLQNAHSPAQPDWRVLSAQGTAADQMGDHARAQGFYDAALKIVPNEPTVLSNLGMSYLLARQLDQGEATLRLAAAQPRADARVRQNLALCLGLKGQLAEAETLLRQDLGPDEAAANVASLRAMVAQSNSWKAIRAADGRTKGNAPRG